MNLADVVTKVGIALLALMTMAVPARADLRRWTPVPGKSAVAFTAGFPLGNFTGRTQDVTGELRVDPADLRQGVTGLVRVKPGGLRTGVDARDREMYKTLAVDRYPDIQFTVVQVEASFSSTTDRADVLLTISGLMLIRGVERPMMFRGRVRLRDNKLWVRGEAELKMSEFGIRPPTRFFFEVKETVLVSFDLLLADDP